jgi:hypothetical protein
MNCYVHPETAAVATCVNCGKFVCSECATNIGGKIYCRSCASSGVIASSSTKTNTLALVSMILGIAGIPLSFCYGMGVLSSIAALITGIIARKQIKDSAGKETGDGMALAGIILGSIFGILILLAVVVIVILALMGPAIGSIFSNIVQEI